MTSVAAAGIPDQMEPPITSINLADNHFVQVDWIAPYDGADAITEYKIMIQAADKNYYTTSECVSVAPTLVTQCLIAMTTLRAAPFSLLYNQTVKVTLQARNTNGWSDTSEANTTGARI